MQNNEYYQSPEDGEQILTFYADVQQVTSHSKTDSFGRKMFDELQLGTGFVSRRYDYVVGDVTDEHKTEKKLKSSPTTQLVSRIIYADGRTIEYEYDAEERITKVIDSVDGTTEYTYDALGQLLTETVNGVVVNRMEYDNYGNILTKNGVTYGYDSTWKDLLTSYNGKTITYDKQGNPRTYRGHSTMFWEKGRQLKLLYVTGGARLEFAYNANGIRTSKAVQKNNNTVEHTYVVDGTKILSETWPEGGETRTLYAHYDNEGSICGITYDHQGYFFVKNQQGDIIAITNKDGEVIARYRYDAWGKVVSILDADGADISSNATHIANINPFRYRGYYYDTETGLYYLQSRYYDPETGRFINADETEINLLLDETILNNLYTYCYNNTVSYVDPDGYKAKDLETYLKLKNGKAGKLKIQIKKNKITIFARFMVFGDLAYKRLEYRPYLVWFSNGILRIWKGTFNVFGYRVTLSTELNVRYSSAPSLQGIPSNCIAVIMSKQCGTSHVSYPIWGWRKDSPGNMYLYRGDKRNSPVYYNSDEFERVCAHEFGHILGVLDLYKKSDKIKEKYSYRGNYSMMCNQFKAPNINNYDLEKVLLAYQKNRVQDWS